MSDVLTPERLDSYCGWCDGDRIAVSDGAPCLDSIHAAADQLRATLAARDAQLAALVGALEQAGDRMEAVWNVLHPGEFTAEERDRMATDLWFGQEEVRKALAAAPVPPALDEQCPERCLGIVGHSGPHQTSDYVPPDDIDATIRQLAREALTVRDRYTEHGWLMNPLPHDAEVRARLARQP